MTQGSQAPKSSSAISPLSRLVTAPAIDLEPEVEASALRALGDIPLDEIGPDPHQPRKHFDREALEDLAATIRSHGVIQPVTLRRRKERDPAGAPKWILISGERRWRASQLASKRVIPACERVDTDPVNIAEAALIENVQRADLNPIELADHLADLHALGRSQESLGALLGGKSKATVSKLLGLRDLPAAAQQALREGRIQPGHGFLLKEFPISSIRDLIQQIEAGNLSVRQMEKLQADQKNGHSQRRPPAARASPDIQALESRLSAFLNARIQIQQKPKGVGELRITFSSNDELEGVLEKMGCPKEGS